MALRALVTVGRTAVRTTGGTAGMNAGMPAGMMRRSSVMLLMGRSTVVLMRALRIAVIRRHQ